MKKIKILILSSALITLFSCQKLLEIKETDFIGGDVALKTVLNNEQGLIGAYAAMNVEMGILLNAVFADEVVTADFYNAATVHEWQYGTQDVSIRDQYTAITLYYRIIDRVNRVLQALPNATAANSTQEALRSRIRGEALFLRAFCHFELYRYYSNSSVGTDLAMAYMEVPSLQPTARITVAPYFQKLKSDLVAAKPLLPVYSASSDIFRATNLAASALQARVALYLKEWNDAITFSTEYINGIPLASRADFPGIWTDANRSELAFKLSRTASTGGRIGSLFRGTSANASNIGGVTWTVSQKLWDSYDQINDVRFSSYYKNEPLLAGGSRKYTRLIKKYEGTTYGTPNENVADAKVFRTGEMYLIRAEARAENNDLVGAATDLNTLRTARINGYTPVILASKDAAITQIMEERFKELPYEGHRFFDLKRRNLPVVRITADLPNPAAQAILPAGNFRFLLPIPSTEIQANPLMQQNPGYAN
ncbi:MAG: RagB/SusD family nutrient uptake outer membrane protein [Sediminibacterium sp.]